MKPVTRYQSQLLFRKSYKPNRKIRFRRASGLVFRPTRMGLASKDYEYETYRIPVRLDGCATESTRDPVAAE